MKEETLFQYEQLFDILELELLPGEDPEEDEVYQNAVKEYYNYLREFNFWDYEKAPELQIGCDALRRLLRDLGEGDFTTVDKVWKVIATLDNYSLLLFTPMIGYMWN